MFTIRYATPNDLEDVYRLICDLEGKPLSSKHFAQNYEANLSDSSIHYLVACDDEKVIGFLSIHVQRILHHENLTCELQELYILPDYRSRGVGRLMMEYAKKLAVNLGLEEIELTTRVSRTRAQEFYKRLGYANTHLKFVKKLR